MIDQGAFGIISDYNGHSYQDCIIKHIKFRDNIDL
jgi:hypothetical protein